MIIDFLDRAVARGKTKERFLESDAQAMLQREVVDKLKTLIDCGPNWINEIRTASLNASKIVKMVRSTDWSTDREVDRLCVDIEEIGNRNPNSISTGLETFKHLSWRSLVTSKGEINVNAPANIRSEIISLMSVGEGSADAIQKNVKQLLARVEFLEKNRPLEPQSTPDPEPQASIKPPPATDKPLIRE